jgi:ABC-type Fe3+-hydroxamate transport system substrate-binding protein
LREILSIPGAPSRGNIISFDLETVGVDLGPVPLDEVLDFRREHGKEYREYSRSVRRFTRQLSRLEPEEREQAFKDREEELEDIAAELENRSLKAWKRPASFALGMAGAAWTVAGGGDPVGAVLTTAAGLLGGSSGQHNEAGAYSYLFQASERYA